MSTKEESIKLKIAKAKMFLAEVDVLIQNRFYTTAINRLYYACFHATKALLLTKDVIPKTHSGVVAMLHKQFVQAGSFDMEQAAFFSRLMQERIVDDYSDVITLSETDVIEFIEPAKRYVEYITNLIFSSGPGMY
jgi:uncharacterized protein (UPF0332 family)